MLINEITLTFVRKEFVLIIIYIAENGPKKESKCDINTRNQ